MPCARGILMVGVAAGGHREQLGDVLRSGDRTGVRAAERGPGQQLTDAVEVTGVDEFGIPVQQVGDLEFGGHSCPITTGRPGWLATSGADGGAPAATRCAANEAIIAPLSVHSRGRGMRSVKPRAAQRSSASSRSRELAATPPAINSVETPRSAAARTAFIVRTSATASWNPAATSACRAEGFFST